MGEVTLGFFRTGRKGPFTGRLVDTTVCVDGTEFDIQAHYGAYCEPRTDEGPWTAVEVDTTWCVEAFARYLAEGPDEHGHYIYARVPVEIVEAVVAEHGGLARP